MRRIRDYHAPAAAEEEVVGPAPGVPTVSLAEAVGVALKKNYGLLSSADSVQSARINYSAARAQFYPQLVPSYSRASGESNYGLRNSRRAQQAQERAYELGRQRLAVDVARSFYQIVQQRQLLAVSRQSLKRSESLLKASEARLAVGLVSKLDVFRAELQTSQAQDSMVRSQASL